MSALKPAEATGTPRPPIVLVVDDNELARRLLAFIVQQHGFDVRSASSGWEAVEVCSREPVDLVILDVVMPGLDGPKTLEILKVQNPSIRCCFATGEPGTTAIWSFSGAAQAGFSRNLSPPRKLARCCGSFLMARRSAAS